MGVQVIDSDFKGPLQPNTVGLLLGRSSSALKGLIVHPGVIDPDYTGVVKIIVSAPKGVVVINKGDRIAQLLILPSLHQQYPSRAVEREERGLGSSGSNIAYIALDLKDRPMLTLKINGKRFNGLLDTGADRSIIARDQWPTKWPMQMSDQTLRGLGYAASPDVSSETLKWEDDEGHFGMFQPFILELPMTLWGRDILTKLGFKLTNDTNYSKTALNLMKNMGYVPGLGIGQRLQGASEVVNVSGNNGRCGLGFS